MSGKLKNTIPFDTSCFFFVSSLYQAFSPSNLSGFIYSSKQSIIDKLSLSI
jgi:hypothetical protein